MKQQLSIPGFFSQFVTSTLKGEEKNKVQKKISHSKKCNFFFPSHGKSQEELFKNNKIIKLYPCH
jgi:hypothetical protein